MIPTNVVIKTAAFQWEASELAAKLLYLERISEIQMIIEI